MDTTKNKQEIDKFFLQDRVDLFDENHFKPYKSTLHPSVRLPAINNHDVHLEVRGYCQHLAKKSATSRFYGVISSFTLIETFLNLPEYADIKSITDVPKSDLITGYKEYFESTGRRVQKISKRGRFNASMEEEYTNRTHLTFSTLSNLYDFAYEQIHGKPSEEEWDFNNDVWSLDDINITKKINASRPIHTVTFSKIKTSWIKHGAKSIMKAAIETGTSIATARARIIDAQILDEFWRTDLCAGSDPEETTAEVLEDRVTFERLIVFLRKKYKLENTYSAKLHSVTNFILLSDSLGCDGFTPKLPLLPYDTPKKVHDDPRPFSDRELSQIIKALPNTNDEMLRDITLLMILQGFRISDVCGLEIYDYTQERCLKAAPKETIDLMYYQHKTKKWTLVPLQNESAQIISKWIDKTIEKFDNPVFVFQTEGESSATRTATDDAIEAMPAKTANLQNFLNRMVADNRIMGDDGKLLSIKSHAFRKTFATKFIELTDDPVATSQMLGQKGLSSLYAYVKVSQNERIEAMKELHQENNELIANIGRNEYFDNIALFDNAKKISRPEDLGGIPLSNGSCIKKGDICNHANSCYKCSLFKPMIEYLPVYKAQLSHMQLQLSFSKLQGYPTVARHYEETIEAIQKCIDKLTKETNHDKN